MKKLLLLLCFVTLSLAQKTVAQTASLATVPIDVELGSTVPFTITYTSSVSCKLAVAVFIFDVDGSGNLTPDWGTWKAGIVSDVLPAATDASATLSLNLPGSIDPSSALPSGKTYVWSLTLTDVNDGWMGGNMYATTFIAPTGVVNAIDFTGTAPTTISAGSTVMLSYNYTLVEDGIVKIALSKYNSSDLWINDVATFIVNPTMATASTATQASAEITVPSDVILSEALTNGENYKFEISLFNPDWSSYLSGKKSDVTVSAPAGVAQNGLQKAVVYPNPAISTLYIAGTDVQNVKVADATGKVLVNSGAVNSIDVSQLASGIYFLSINNARAHTFIKQ